MFNLNTLTWATSVHSMWSKCPHGMSCNVEDVSGEMCIRDRTMTFASEPMAKTMSFQREYAEAYDWVAQQFKDWAFTPVSYTHLDVYKRQDQQRGCCEVTEGKYEITIYTSCCNTAKGIYYYTTYDNHQITAVDMHAENLDSDQLICYPLLSKGEVRWQNK